MAKYLIVVDYQNDFVDGTLGSLSARNIFPNILEKIRKRVKDGWQVIFTFDTHFENYLDTQEGKKLPVLHCIEGTPGWEIYRDLVNTTTELIQNYNRFVAPFSEISLPGPLLVKKTTFGYTEWKYLIPDAEEIEVVGVCTDICVISNVLILKAQFPEIPISVDASCCAGVTKASHEAALDTMKACQVNVSRTINLHKNTDEYDGIMY